MGKVHRFGIRTRKFFHLLIQTAGFISAVLTILFALGVTSATFGFLNHNLFAAISSLLVAVFSVLLFILFYTLLEERLKAHPLQPLASDTIKYPPPPQGEDVEILLKEIVYEYASDGKTMWQRKRLQMKVLQNGLIFFTDRYHWSGNGSHNLRSLTPGYSITNQRKDDIEGKWDYFDVKFPHHARNGDIFDFTLEWELIDDEKTAIPYLSTMVDRETKHLLLQVVLPRELTPTRAYCYVFASFMETLPVETHKIEWSPASRSIRYEIPQPKRSHKYTIRWYHN